MQHVALVRFSRWDLEVLEVFRDLKTLDIEGYHNEMKESERPSEIADAAKAMVCSNKKLQELAGRASGLVIRVNMAVFSTSGIFIS